MLRSLVGSEMCIRDRATGDAAGVLAKHLGTVVLPEADRLTALHYAYLRDGVPVSYTHLTLPTIYSV